MHFLTTSFIAPVSGNYISNVAKGVQFDTNHHMGWYCRSGLSIDDHDIEEIYHCGVKRHISKYDQELKVYMNSMGSGVSLQKTIRRDEFFKISEADLLRQVRDCFSDELERLRNAYAVEKGSSPQIETYHQMQKQTPSEILYGENHDEINRTLTGVLALRWIINGDYDVFVSGQAEKVRLTQESFAYLQKFFKDHLQNHEDLFALVLSMVVNDLGKDPELETDYYLKTRDNTHRLSGQNHDAILFEAAKADMVPCLDLLSESYRADIMLGLELGSQLNAGQLAQAENSPVNLEGLLEMRGHEHAFHLKYMEQVLDVAGASAHFDPRGARNFIEPVFQGFKTVYEVSLDIIEGKCTLRQGYDKVLTKRGNLLVKEGFRRLSVTDRDDRALLRLLTMGRTTTKQQADLFAAAFEALDPEYRELLVTGLNIDGNVNETVVLPYYMPAMLSETLTTIQNLSPRGQQNALSSLMRYLARVLRSTGTEALQNMPEDWQSQLREQQRQMGWECEDGNFPGIVIERNMMKARETISREEFKKNPAMLDELEIPRGQVLQRRRTSHSVVEMSPMTAKAMSKINKTNSD